MGWTVLRVSEVEPRFPLTNSLHNITLKMVNIFLFVPTWKLLSPQCTVESRHSKKSWTSFQFSNMNYLKHLNSKPPTTAVKLFPLGKGCKTALGSRSVCDVFRSSWPSVVNTQVSIWLRKEIHHVPEKGPGSAFWYPSTSGCRAGVDTDGVLAVGKSF